MLQNFHLLNNRTELPITQVQFLPSFLHHHETEAIKVITDQIPFSKGEILGSNNNSNIIYRDSSIKWVEWNDDNWWLYTRIMEKVKELNDRIWQFELYGINEFLQYTEYEAKPSGRGHYDYHMDLSHFGVASNRKISFEIILEDDYEGGDFSLLMGPTEQKVTLKKGDAVFYPSFLMNKVYPIRAGKRTSLVGWVAGPAFRELLEIIFLNIEPVSQQVLYYSVKPREKSSLFYILRLKFKCKINISKYLFLELFIFTLIIHLNNASKK